MRQTATFKDPSGALVDPSVVTVTATPENGTPQTPTPSHVSTGVYRATIDTSGMSGWLKIAWDGAGVDAGVTTFGIDTP